MDFHDVFSDKQVFEWLDKKLYEGYSSEMQDLKFYHGIEMWKDVNELLVTFQYKNRRDQIRSKAGRSDFLYKIEENIQLCLDYEAVCNLIRIENLGLADMCFSMCFGFGITRAEEIIVDIELILTFIDQKYNLELGGLRHDNSKCLSDMIHHLKKTNDDLELLKATVDGFESRPKRKM